MRLFFPSIICFTLVCCTQSESDLKNQFYQELKVYLNHYNSREWDKMMSYLNPRIFEISPKENLIEMFKNLDTSGLNIQIDLKEIDRISPVIQFADGRFCRIYYHAILKIKLSGSMLENKDLLLSNYKSIYGDDAVIFKEQDDEIVADAHLSMVAFSDATTQEQWKYLEVNAKEKMLTEKLIPQEVREQILMD